MSYEKEKELENMPYTVVGHSSMGDGRLHITLTGEGILHLAKKVKKDDLVCYTTWTDISDEGRKKTYYSKWEISKKKRD